ncbi:YycH family regulatory protein [Virgibacillus ihumii]|uniref:YycH family regulatory protein n=1 Tax=Virgibacillus ihumii TaxID=2686091 RepID=UPI00157CA069|nr:two-component system activity regulator YycH [Virgibacillus ihumii]
MNAETVKSIILWVLVLLSLLLTFSLWNFQPNLELSNSSEYVDQVDLGGKEVTKEEIIEPKSIVFHNGNTYYGFSDPKDMQSLYHDMQSWEMYNFQFSGQNGEPSQEKQLEIIFPESMPMQMAKTLFTFNEDKSVPEWSFKKIFITFNTDDSVLNVIFVAENGEQRASAVVNNSRKYDMLWSYLTTFEGLREYMLVESGSRPYYVPKHQIKMNRKVLTINTINPSLLVDALFPTPDVVSRNEINESRLYFSDGIRGMRVDKNIQRMQFDNPYQSTSRPLTDVELITQSVQKINAAKGWTGEYNLMHIQSPDNIITYQMYYNGFPIYSTLGLSVIEQKWLPTEISVELNMYNRPLFQLNNLINENTVTLKPASGVLSYLENSSTYELENISDLRVGYYLSYQGIDTNNVVQLQPGWFMEYSGKWQQVEFNDEMQFREGGAEDAMETD